MKKFYLNYFLFFNLFWLSLNLNAFAAKPETFLVFPKLCENKISGYSINCRPDWGQEHQASGDQFTIVAEDGQILNLTISKSDEPGLTYEALTPALLKKSFGYENAFKIGKVKLGRYRAIYVEASSTQAFNTVLWDYFVIHNNRLYRISFSAKQKSALKNNGVLVKSVLNSFKLLD